MFQRPRRLTSFALLATAAIVFGACSGAAATPTPTTAPTTAPSAAPATPTAAAYAAMSYPASGPADCKAANYTGEFKQIKALDENDVEFDLCFPDPAFLSKVAFSSFQINDSDYLAKHVPDGSILTQPNGTGPYMLKEWVKGDHMTFVANPNYWGTPALTPTAILRWSTEAAQRLTELQSGNVDGYDNPGTDDYATIAADPSLKLYPREGLNVFYLGMNVLDKPFDNPKVRQAIAMGIDKQRIVDNFYPAGSTVANYFTPCSILGGCEGTPYPAFNLAAARALLVSAGFPTGFSAKLQYRDVSRGYLPQATQVAQDIQAQLKANLNINLTIDVQESATYLDNNAAGKLDGIFMLGWGADYPDQTDFMDYHFGSGSGAKFGQPFPDIAAAISAGGQTADPAARKAAYATANTLLAQDDPAIPIANGASATVFKADVQGAHSSPLTSEQLFVMKPGDRNQLVFMQNAEPNSLYCADETDGESLRACEQVGQSLYGFKTGSDQTEPVLATACTPNADATVWTCALRKNVKFADGSAFDANDVVVSYAVQWDTKNPLHKGRTGAFDYFPGLFGGFLNPPAP